MQGDLDDGGDTWERREEGAANGLNYYGKYNFLHLESFIIEVFDKGIIKIHSFRKTKIKKI